MIILLGKNLKRRKKIIKLFIRSLLILLGNKVRKKIKIINRKKAIQRNQIIMFRNKVRDKISIKKTIKNEV